jgi:hypothetical protein
LGRNQGRFGSDRGGPFAKEGRLALAGVLRLLQPTGQVFDLGFELGGAMLAVGDESVACAAA